MHTHPMQAPLLCRFAWVTRALAINEFTAAHWMRPNPSNPGSTLGIDVLQFRWGALARRLVRLALPANRLACQPASPFPCLCQVVLSHAVRWAALGCAVRCRGMPRPRLVAPRRHAVLCCAALCCRGFPTEYWWTWASVGFVLASLALLLLLFIATMTFIGGERGRGERGAAAGPKQGGGRCGAPSAHASPLTPPLPMVPAPPAAPRAAPRQRRTITPEALQDFQLSRKELLTPQPSFAEQVRAWCGWCVALVAPVCGMQAPQSVCWSPGMRPDGTDAHQRIPVLQDMAEQGMVAWPSTATQGTSSTNKSGRLAAADSATAPGTEPLAGAPAGPAAEDGAVRVTVTPLGGPTGAAGRSSSFEAGEE